MIFWGICDNGDMIQKCLWFLLATKSQVPFLFVFYIHSRAYFFSLSKFRDLLNSIQSSLDLGGCFWSAGGKQIVQRPGRKEETGMVVGLVMEEKTMWEVARMWMDGVRRHMGLWLVCVDRIWERWAHPGYSLLGMWICRVVQFVDFEVRHNWIWI